MAGLTYPPLPPSLNPHARTHLRSNLSHAKLRRNGLMANNITSIVVGNEILVVVVVVVVVVVASIILVPIMANILRVETSFAPAIDIGAHVLREGLVRTGAGAAEGSIHSALELVDRASARKQSPLVHVLAHLEGEGHVGCVCCSNQRCVAHLCFTFMFQARAACVCMYSIQLA